MASAFSHAIVALTLGKVSNSDIINWRTLALGIFCSVVPDLDVIGFRYGVHYGDLWGHRGITHSLFFAVLLSAVLVCAFYFRKPTAAIVGVFLYLFVCTASHGVLDAMTNGGLGVAFFSPFNTERYFFGFRPIVVSPIGVHQFFNERGLQVLASEAKWVWLPSFLVVVIGRAFKGNGSSARVA